MTRKLLLAFILILAQGCNSSPQQPSSNASIVDRCPKKAQGTLAPEDVKQISLNQGAIRERGYLNSSQQKGYSFNAKKGDKLSFKTKEDVCIWIYTPSNVLLDGNVFSEEGSYVMQVSVAKGSTSFTLEIALESPSTPIAAQNPANSNVSSPKPAESSSVGWIWIGALRDSAPEARVGDALIPSKTQPVTIYPPIVPAIGAQVVTTTNVNARSSMPQPPNYDLANQVGILSQGQKLTIHRIDAFIDPKTQITRVWAEIGLSP